MPSHGPLLPVRFDGIEGAKQAEELEWVFSHPIPGAHFEGERQEVLLPVGQVQVIPQVSVGGVMKRLGLDPVNMVRECPVQQGLENPDLVE